MRPGFWFLISFFLYSLLFLSLTSTPTSAQTFKCKLDSSSSISGTCNLDIIASQCNTSFAREFCLSLGDTAACESNQTYQCSTPPTPIPFASRTPTPFAPGPIFDPCSVTTDPEFHPLRPYPLKPCDQQIPAPEHLTFACGQPFVPTGRVLLPPDATTCEDDPSKLCSTQNITYNVSINLADAKIPFLGNTTNPNLSDAAKANEYLNYYLNGTVQQSDQQYLDPKSTFDQDLLINYSGPVKKLLPYESQQQLRRTLKEGPIGRDLDPQSYHNYIVGCQKDIDFEYIKRIFTDAIPAGQIAQIEVFNFVVTLAQTAWDIRDQINTRLPLITTAIAQYFETGNLVDLSPLASFPSLQNSVVALFKHSQNTAKAIIYQINTLSINLPESCGTSSTKIRLWDFFNHLPPKPENFQSESDYNRALIDWYEYLHIDHPFGTTILDKTPGVWSSLFQNIPFSSLEDTVGEIVIDLNSDSIPKGANDPKGITLTITNPNGPKDVDSRVYIPHVRNIDTLSKILTSTFRSGLLPNPVPTVNTTDINLLSENLGHQTDLHPNYNDPYNNSSLISSVKTPTRPIDDSQYCEVSQIRVHDGDPIKGKTITANLNYTQTFKYDPPPPGSPAGATCTINDQCSSKSCVFTSQPSGPPLGKCANLPAKYANTSSQIATYSRLPLLGKIYSTLVGGSQSLVRRFAPAALGKCEGSDQCVLAYTESSCTQIPSCSWTPDEDTIKDKPEKVIPAKSDTNSAVTGSSDNVTSASVGQPSGIYFPYLGSLADYVLGLPSFEKFNLQKALRPEGFKSVAAGDFSVPAESGQYPIVGPPQAECKMSSDQLNAAIGAASAKYKVPASMLKAINHMEGFYYYRPDQPWPQGCFSNNANAVGPMQITDLTYPDVTTVNERVDNVASNFSCTQVPDKLNRCNVYDAMELAARTLLVKVYGCWNCSAAKTGINTFKDIYNSACRYYGGFGYDNATVDRGRELVPNATDRRAGDTMNYCDNVCGYMHRTGELPNQCPAYPQQRQQ